jgi:hypothetical protein
MTPWLEVLIDPTRVLDDRGGQPSALVAAAFLVRGQVREYQELASARDYPRLGEWPAEDLSGPLALLGALGLQVAGQPSIGLYSRLLADSGAEASVRAAAVVLGAIALGDDDREDAGLEMIRSADVAGNDVVSRGFLLHHQAVHAAYLGDFAGAADLARRVAAEETDDTTRAALTVRYLARRNEYSFRWLMGNLEAPSLERRAGYPVLAESDGPVFDALAAYLETVFKGSFDDPFTRTITFQSEDDVESSLRTALFRSSCMADWNTRLHYQRLLAKYRLLNALGETTMNPEPDFVQLVRAADTDATRRAARTYVRVGPLQPLASAATHVAARTWTDFDIGANFALLASAAPLLSLRDASACATRILVDLDDIVSRRHGTALVSHDAMDAVGAMLPWAGVRVQGLASRTLRAAATAGDAIVLDALPRALRGLKWTALRPSEQEAWLGYVDRHLSTEDAHQRVAAEAAIGISEVRPADAAAAVDRGYQSSRSVLVIALMTDLALPSLVAALPEAIRQVADQVESYRAAAAAGRMTLGGTVNLPLLLGRLLLQRDVRDGWKTLLRFARDSAAPIDERASVLNLLAERREEVPPKRLAMMRGTISPSTLSFPLHGSPEALTGAALRFRASFRDISSSDALNELLGLTTHTSRLARVEAARSLAHLTLVVQREVLFALGLSLAQDADDLVRAGAARFLPRLAPDLSADQREILANRMRALLSEPGETVPLAALHGLRHAREAEAELTAAVRPMIKAMRRRHPSARVRAIAVTA